MRKTTFHKQHQTPKNTYIKRLLKTANDEKNREKYTFNLSSILD